MDFVAQITGSGVPIPGAIAPTYVSGGNTDITAVLQQTRFILITTATGNSTVLTNAVPRAGALVAIQINNDSGGARTITFGTGFRPTGTLVGTASKAYVVLFFSDGTTLNECSRSVGALT
jgi:hypothetical protein